MSFSASADVDGREVDRVICKHLCSECWGELYFFPNTQSYSCHTPDCSCSSPISKATIRRREAEDAHNYRKAKDAMADALGLPGRKAPQSQAEMLADLGFS